MKKQSIFNFNFKKIDSSNNFYVNQTNTDAYNTIQNSKINNIYLKGPIKSGKSSLAKFWQKKYKAIKYNNNFDLIINSSCNVYIDNLDKSVDEEKIFHILNHCKLNNLLILITSRFEIDEINFSLSDLTSRLKVFTYSKINQPDDDMLTNLLTKFFIEKQFIIYHNEVFKYLLNNADRSYESMYRIVNKLDALTLEKKRQLTIPLIKEIL